METKIPSPCPYTVTVRRNPHRRARPTPSSAIPLSLPPSSKTTSAIRSFPTEEILSMDVPNAENPKQEILESSSPKKPSDSEKLKVFLRIRPIITQQKVGGAVKNGYLKNAWPQNPSKKKDASKMTKATAKRKNEICLKVNDSHSVTLCPPQNMSDVRRTKSEVYEGFSHVFCAESSQSEVYERMVNPLVDDFLKGKSGMLAAMGPSGSGKTYTIFGSGREPGMVTLALRRIFSEKENNGSKISRTFYLSMFEINSEGGKGEKIMDLSLEGGDLSMQQYNIKGLQEAIIHDVQQAESLIASGMLKRSTAMTNSNIQSSRSQCIINIRSDLDHIDEDACSQSCTALLTIVDLAGAEREKRTGNQGARLLESNFINNTSMVFGLCLRSLLEHQRNPKKPFHKHFQNSLLTKYLRDFLEGKKRMALILTAKSGEEDYHDTSYLLRQASPYMNIKFENVEEQPANTFGNKRRTQTLSKAEQAKRMKFSCKEVCMDGEVKGDILHQLHNKVLTQVQVKEVETNDSSVEGPEIINKATKDNKSIDANIADSVKRARENHILLNFSRALWSVLKEYKNKLEASENTVDAIRHCLAVEKQRCSALEAELNAMKTSCSCGKDMMAKVILVGESESKAKTTSCSLEPERYEPIDVHELNAQVSSSSPVKLECTKKKHTTADTVTSSVTSVVLLPDCFNPVNIDNQVDAQVYCSNLCEAEHVNNVPCEYVVFDKEDLNELEDTHFSNDIPESAASDSELVVLGDEISSFMKQYQRQHKEESNAQASSSDPNESECFGKQDILDDMVISAVEVTSISGDFEKLEDQRNEEVDVSSTDIEFNEEEIKEVEERDTRGERTGCDTSISAGGGLELPSVAEDKSSCTLEEDKPQQEEEEVSVPVSSSSDLDGLKGMEKGHALDSSDVPDEQSFCSEDIISSHGCNAASKKPEPPSVQPSPSSNAAKPKRRLRPASSVLLRNINILDFDDAAEMPKYGKRGEKDVDSKRTQGSISLLRLLKQNVH